MGNSASRNKNLDLYKEFEGIETLGYRVLGIQPNSPAGKAGLVSFFDFLIGANGAMLLGSGDDVDEGEYYNDVDFPALLLAFKNKPLELLVWNIKSQTKRLVTIVPSDSWGGAGLLGAIIRLDNYAGADERLIRILSVEHNSPAAVAGLVPTQDYLLGTTLHSFDSTKVLAKVLYENFDQAVDLYVYNTDSDLVRIVSLMPTLAWGGNGSLGAEVGTGYLHGLPKECRESLGGSVERKFNVILPEKEQPSNQENDFKTPPAKEVSFDRQETSDSMLSVNLNDTNNEVAGNKPETPMSEPKTAQELFSRSPMRKDIIPTPNLTPTVDGKPTEESAPSPSTPNPEAQEFFSRAPTVENQESEPTVVTSTPEPTITETAETPLEPTTTVPEASIVKNTDNAAEHLSSQATSDQGTTSTATTTASDATSATMTATMEPSTEIAEAPSEKDLSGTATLETSHASDQGQQHQQWQEQQTQQWQEQQQQHQQWQEQQQQWQAQQQQQQQWQEQQQQQQQWQEQQQQQQLWQQQQQEQHQQWQEQQQQYQQWQQQQQQWQEQQQQWQQQQEQMWHQQQQQQQQQQQLEFEKLMAAQQQRLEEEFNKKLRNKLQEQEERFRIQEQQLREQQAQLEENQRQMHLEKQLLEQQQELERKEEELREQERQIREQQQRLATTVVAKENGMASGNATGELSEQQQQQLPASTMETLADQSQDQKGVASQEHSFSMLQQEMVGEQTKQEVTSVQQACQQTPAEETEAQQPMENGHGKGVVFFSTAETTTPEQVPSKPIALTPTHLLEQVTQEAQPMPQGQQPSETQNNGHGPYHVAMSPLHQVRKKLSHVDPRHVPAVPSFADMQRSKSYTDPKHLYQYHNDSTTTTTTPSNGNNTKDKITRSISMDNPKEFKTTTSPPLSGYGLPQVAAAIHGTPPVSGGSTQQQQHVTMFIPGVKPPPSPGLPTSESAQALFAGPPPKASISSVSNVGGLAAAAPTSGNGGRRLAAGAAVPSNGKSMYSTYSSASYFSSTAPQPYGMYSSTNGQS